MRQLKEGTLQLLLLCFTKQSLAKIKLEIAAFSFSQFRWQHGLATILLIHSWNEPVYQYFFPCASLNILILPKLIFWAKWQPGHSNNLACTLMKWASFFLYLTLLCLPCHMHWACTTFLWIKNIITGTQENFTCMNRVKEIFQTGRAILLPV